MMKSLFFVLMMGFISYANAYDDYNILSDSSLDQDELEYYTKNCKYGGFSYTCIIIEEKIKETNFKKWMKTMNKSPFCE